MSITSIIRDEVNRALSRVRNAFRAVTSSTLKMRTTAPVLGSVRGLGDQPLPDLEVMQHAGLVAGLPVGTPVIVLPMGGSSTHSVIIASDSGAYRIDVGVGEVALHHLTEPDCHVWLKAGRVVGLRGRRIVLQADEEVVLDAPNVTATGDVQAAGVVDGQSGVVSSGIEFDTHVHGLGGGVTEGPQ